MPSRKKILLLLLAFFLLRLVFGLFRSRMFEEVDYLQTYLIGLKCYTTGTWPWFGPDLNGAENSFKSQIPGALEGVLIGWPFYILPFPEAPFILLNLLSMAGVALLAWYIHRRLPTLPFGWLLAWIAVCPWSIHETTTLINPAYIFLPSVLFFIGFMETLPYFSLDLLPPALANAAMGFSFFWVMQFHFSYVYLGPLILFSLAVQVFPPVFPPLLVKSKGRIPGPVGWRSILYFLLGALPTLAFLVPTFLKFGFSRGNVASGFAVPFNWDNVLALGTILARFLSVVCFELPRFIGDHTKSRLHFLLVENPVLLLPGAFLWIAGLLQPLVLLFSWFKKGRTPPKARAVPKMVFFKDSPFLSTLLAPFARLGAWISLGNPFPKWEGLRWLLLGVFGMAYVSFWFTVKKPLSHIFLVLFPLIMLYSCYCWAAFQGQKHWRWLAKVTVAAAVVFQLGYAVAVAPRDSIYPKWKLIKRAIDAKDYRLLGERRPESSY